MNWKIRLLAIFALNLTVVLVVLWVRARLELISLRYVMMDYDLLDAIFVYSLFSFMSISVARDVNRSSDNEPDPFRESGVPKLKFRDNWKAQMEEITVLHVLFLLPIFVIIESPGVRGSVEHVSVVIALLLMAVASWAVNMIHLDRLKQKDI